MTAIPKLLHQLWIGDASKAPTRFMATWRDAHVPLGFEYVFWNEAEIARRSAENVEFAEALSMVQPRVDEMEEINGKADIIRWAILKVYGGVFCDADSICVAPLDDALMRCKEGAFSGFENEHVRGPGWSPNYKEIHSHKHALIALGCVGFPPRHPLVVAANQWIKENPVSVIAVGQRAWYSVGPGLITRLYYGADRPRYEGSLKVCPSHYFLPMHYSGVHYYGHEKVYAYQEWGSTKQSYATMNEVEMPSSLREPPAHEAHSVLLPTYNTKASHLRACLDSIKQQHGHFWIDLVCVDDGSDALHASLLGRMLADLERTTRWVRVHLHTNQENVGICASLAKGLAECPKTNRLVFRMDADDVMVPQRMAKQAEYMQSHPSVVLCGAQVHIFDDRTGRVMQTTSHPTVTWEDYRRGRCASPHWMTNHPTFCFRLDEVVRVGGYNANIHSVCEDFDLVLRVMMVYGGVHNLSEALLYYRIHDEQITKVLRSSGDAARSPKDWGAVRNRIIQHYLECDLHMREGGECVPFAFDAPDDPSPSPN